MFDSTALFRSLYDTGPYGPAQTCTVAGVAVAGIFSHETPDSFEIVASLGPTLRIQASVAASVGDAVVVNGQTYIIASIHVASIAGDENILSLK
jgi:hypothetical protein